jgi:hypothetical protein
VALQGFVFASPKIGIFNKNIEVFVFAKSFFSKTPKGLGLYMGLIIKTKDMSQHIENDYDALSFA